MGVYHVALEEWVGAVMTSEEWTELRQKLIGAKVKLGKNGPPLKKSDWFSMSIEDAELLVAQSLGKTVEEFRQIAGAGLKTITHGLTYGRAMHYFEKDRYYQSGLKCRNNFPIRVDGVIEYYVHCSRGYNHNGNHAGRSHAGLSVEWNDQQRAEALRPPPRKVVGAITAWRCWALAKHDILQSVSSHDLWEGPVMTTARGRDGLPSRVRSEDPDHEREGYLLVDHGVHAYRTVEALRDNWLVESGGHYPVVGRVDLTGHVIVHELGYRAQKATIRELWYFRPNDPFMAQVTKDVGPSLERRYGCDVHVVDTRKFNGWVKYMMAEERAEKTDGIFHQEG